MQRYHPTCVLTSAPLLSSTLSSTDKAGQSLILLLIHHGRFIATTIKFCASLKSSQPTTPPLRKSASAQKNISVRRHHCHSRFGDRIAKSLEFKKDDAGVVD